MWYFLLSVHTLSTGQFCWDLSHGALKIYFIIFGIGFILTDPFPKNYRGYTETSNYTKDSLEKIFQGQLLKGFGLHNLL